MECGEVRWQVKQTKKKREKSHAPKECKFNLARSVRHFFDPLFLPKVLPRFLIMAMSFFQCYFALQMLLIGVVCVSLYVSLSARQLVKG